MYTLLVVDRAMFGGTMGLDFMDFADVSELAPCPAGSRLR